MGFEWQTQTKFIGGRGIITKQDSTFFDKFLIYSEYDACVSISCDAVSIDTVVDVKSETFKRIALPTLTELDLVPDTVIDFAITFASSAPIGIIQYVGFELDEVPSENSLNQLNQKFSEATTLIPNDFLRNNFNSPLNHSESNFLKECCPFSGRRTLLIGSLEDSNHIEIEFGQVSRFVDRDTTYVSKFTQQVESYWIDKNELIVFRPIRSFNFVNNYENVLSRGYLKSKNNKPIKSLIQYGTYTDDSVGAYLNLLDYNLAWEDQLPFDYYGKSFHVPKLQNHIYTSISLKAITDSTVVVINSNRYILNEHEQIDTCINGGIYATSNKEVYSAVHPCPDTSGNNNYESTFFTQLLSDSIVSYRSVIKPIPENTFNNNYYIAVSTPTVGINNFLVDNSPIPSNQFTRFIHDSTWSWSIIEVDTSVHILESVTGFSAIHYSAFDTIGEAIFPSYGMVVPNIPEKSTDHISDFKAGTSLNNLRVLDSISICDTDTLHIYPGDNRWVTWYWNINGSIKTQKIEDNLSGKDFKVTGLQNGVNVIYRYDSLGCHSPDSLIVVVGGISDYKIRKEFYSNCNGAFLSLQLESDPNSGLYVDWIEPIRTINEAQGMLNVNQLTIDTVSIQYVINSANCSDTINEVVSIQSNDSIWGTEILPNFVSPNGDGLNDNICWSNFLEAYEGCFSVTIFNRWDQVIYSTENVYDCWAPNALESQVLFYVINVGNRQKNGFIHVIN